MLSSRRFLKWKLVFYTALGFAVAPVHVFPQECSPKLENCINKTEPVKGAVQGAVQTKPEEKKSQAKTPEVESTVPASPDETSPTSVIKKYEMDVKETVNKYKGKTDKESVKNKNDEILVKVRQFFDIPELAKLSLGDHWEKINNTQREEYSDVFRRLIERSYISQSDKLIGAYEVKYQAEKIKDDTATVKSSVIKEDADVDILYSMHHKPGGWMIYNILVDTTDLVKNYNTQFNNIIGKEGFPGLMRRMKNKLTDTENGD